MTDERLEKALSIKKDIKEAECLLISLERYLAEPDIVFCKIGKRGQAIDLQVCGKEVIKLVKRLRRNQAKLITSLKKQYEML
ncbi:hypothetical protein PF672P2_00063 [Parabacteroides phage PF672P2]|nr:hypothetical protein PF672P1_00020 [Parabacteroides phage PF672P1]WAX17200.1 hypothetical protein PF672P2_00063 [Parabacteroides phage PF672P2]